jgi:hypothetical protein
MTEVSSWSDGPPAEAYGRVSDPGRYAPLRAIAHRVLDELENRYAVTRNVFTEHDRHGDSPATGVRLTPADPAAAPLAVTFTAFPGLDVRMGRSNNFYLPSCGCDACDDSVEDCAEELRDAVHALTAGTFGERLVHDHGWWHEHWYRDAEGGYSRSRSRLRRRELAELRRTMPGGELAWAPWPTRAATSPGPQ